MTRLAIFGTGASGSQCAAAIGRVPGLTLTAAADNAAAVQGTTWHGLTVRSAAALAAADDWDRVCIASQWHAMTFIE